MYKAASPSSERGCFSSKNSTISNQPDIPASNHNYLHEKWFSKSLSSHRHNGLQRHIGRHAGVIMWSWSSVMTVEW
jgi:hypothetical protein